MSSHNSVVPGAVVYSDMRWASVRNHKMDLMRIIAAIKKHLVIHARRKFASQLFSYFGRLSARRVSDGILRCSADSPITGVQLQLANFLVSSSPSRFVPVKLSKLQSSISLFSLPRIDLEPESEEPLSASERLLKKRAVSNLLEKTSEVIQGLCRLGSSRAPRALCHVNGLFRQRNRLLILSLFKQLDDSLIKRLDPPVQVRRRITEISATDCAPRNRADANRDRLALCRYRSPIWRPVPAPVSSPRRPNFGAVGPHRAHR